MPRRATRIVDRRIALHHLSTTTSSLTSTLQRADPEVIDVRRVPRYSLTTVDQLESKKGPPHSGEQAVD